MLGSSYSTLRTSEQAAPFTVITVSIEYRLGGGVCVRVRRGRQRILPSVLDALCWLGGAGTGCGEVQLGLPPGGQVRA
jgi:hypothetical protein